MRNMLVAAAAIAFALGGLGAAAPNPVQVENARPGNPDWLAPPETDAIAGYASESSVAPGDPIHFHVAASPAARYRIEIFRLGWYGGAGARRAACLPACDADEAGSVQPVPAP